MSARVRVCALRAYSQAPCEGPVHRVHWIPSQFIRDHAGLWAVWDKRALTLACGAHHLEHDLGDLRVPRAELPPDLEEYALEHRLTDYLDYGYGVRP